MRFRIKTNVVQMMKNVNERKNPIITRNGETETVLKDMETNQYTKDTFALLNMLKMAEEDIKNGNVINSDDVFKEIRERLTKSETDNKQLGPITHQLTGIIKLNKDINYKELLVDVLMEKYLL